MNFRCGYQWLGKKVKSLLFAAIAIILVTAFVYYIGVYGEGASEGSKVDVLKFSFVFAMLCCLSGCLALIIRKKLYNETYDWQSKILSCFYGPFILIMTALEYFKRKFRHE